MAVVLPAVTEDQADQFEFELADLIDKYDLQYGAQLPPSTLAHILRGVYDKLAENAFDPKEITCVKS